MPVSALGTFVPGVYGKIPPLWARSGDALGRAPFVVFRCMSDPGAPADYEIRVEGVLDARWADWFGDLRVDRDGTQTAMSGPLDQAALHGLLAKIRDLGLCLISVRRAEPGQPGTTRPRQAGGHGPAGRPAPPGKGDCDD